MWAPGARRIALHPAGVLRIHPPRSKAGDSVTFRAEMDLIVGLTACSAELSNNYRFKPIDFEIAAASPGPSGSTDMSI